ncbi:NAD(P)H-dependent oxidoreductase, partial [Kingella denitrificans]
MKKTLVIVAHPDIARSTVNQTWARTLAAQEDRYTVHELYAAYPDGKIDVAAEQALIEAHGSVILQFPVYWFSCPPLLKQWFDSVFTHGWAFGSS